MNIRVHPLATGMSQKLVTFSTSPLLLIIPDNPVRSEMPFPSAF